MQKVLFQRLGQLLRGCTYERVLIRYPVIDPALQGYYLVEPVFRTQPDIKRRFLIPAVKNERASAVKRCI